MFVGLDRRAKYQISEKGHIRWSFNRTDRTKLFNFFMFRIWSRNSKYKIQRYTFSKYYGLLKIVVVQEYKINLPLFTFSINFYYWTLGLKNQTFFISNKSGIPVLLLLYFLSLCISFSLLNTVFKISVIFYKLLFFF